MSIHQHGDRFGDRSGQVSKVNGDSWGCVVIHPPAHTPGLRETPPTSRVDAILAAIDTGLQTAGDTAYGDDWPGTCWRCGEMADDLCAGCREWLHAEVEVPPDSNHSAWPFLAPWQQRIIDECAEIDGLVAP